MKRLLSLSILLSAAAVLPLSPAIGAEPAKKPAAKTEGSLKSDQEKVLYTLGVGIGNKLSTFRLTDAELEIVRQGMSDAVLHRELKIDTTAYAPKIDEMAKSRAKAIGEEQKRLEKPQLEKLAVAKGAVRKPSGLIFTEIKAGSGPNPKLTDKVKLQYQGSLLDGTVFFDSKTQKDPQVFPLEQVTPLCWREGVQLMKAGGKARFVCPSDLAYGDSGALTKIKPGSAIILDVELLEIVK